MAKILEYLNVGNRQNMTVEELLLIVEKMYQDIAINLNKKPDIIQQPSNGVTTDSFLSNGDIWINSATLGVQMVTQHDTASTVVFTTLG